MSRLIGNLQWNLNNRRIAANLLLQYRTDSRTVPKFTSSFLKSYKPINENRSLSKTFMRRSPTFSIPHQTYSRILSNSCPNPPPKQKPPLKRPQKKQQQCPVPIRRLSHPTRAVIPRHLQWVILQSLPAPAKRERSVLVRAMPLPLGLR